MKGWRTGQKLFCNNQTIFYNLNQSMEFKLYSQIKYFGEVQVQPIGCK